MSSTQIPQEWIRQVTEEVRRRLGESAPPAASPVGALPCSRCPDGAQCAASAPGAVRGETSATALTSLSGTPAGATPVDSGSASGADVCQANDHLALLTEYGVERVACCPRLGALDRRLAAMIDHTLLRPEATDREIGRLCEESYCHGFASVCVQPIWVALCAHILQESKVKVCTVVGFPHGANRQEVKAYETQVAVAQGAREIDMVIPVGALKSGDLRAVSDHIRAVVRAARAGVVTKVILETAFLTREEKVAACRIAKEEGATFVKTSTGFGPSGATLEDIQLMRETVGPTMGIKAAGGIRDRATALRMVEAGATRIGASASIRIAGSG